MTLEGVESRIGTWHRDKLLGGFGQEYVESKDPATITTVSTFLAEYLAPSEMFYQLAGPDSVITIEDNFNLDNFIDMNDVQLRLESEDFKLTQKYKIE